MNLETKTHQAPMLGRACHLNPRCPASAFPSTSVCLLQSPCISRIGILTELRMGTCACVPSGVKGCHAIFWPQLAKPATSDTAAFSQVVSVHMHFGLVPECGAHHQDEDV